MNILRSDPIQRKIFLLAVVFFIAFTIIVQVEYILRVHSSKYERTLVNQYARTSLGKIILKKLLTIELECNTLTAMNDLRDLDFCYETVKSAVWNINEALNVLRSGGTYEDRIPANFDNINEINDYISFTRDKASGYVIEIIDLTPRTLDIEQLIDVLYSTGKKKINAQDKKSYQLAQKAMAIQLKRLYTILLRSRENANKIVYDVSQEVHHFEKKRDRVTQFFGHIRIGVILLISVAVILLTIRILAQVTNIINERETFLNNMKKEINIRKQTDDRLRQALITTMTILENVPFGVIIIRKDKKIQRINKTALGMMSFSSEEEFIGKQCHNIVCPFQENKCPILDFGQTIDNSEQVLVCKDGKHLPILKSVILLTLDDEEVLLETFIDISQRKEAEGIMHSYQERLEKEIKERSNELLEKNKQLEDEIEDRKHTEIELKQAQTQLLQSEKMASVGQLAAGVAHEINNPIGFINSNLSTIQEYNVDLAYLIKKYIEFEQSVEGKEKKNSLLLLEEIKKMKKTIDLDFILDDIDKAIKESKEGTMRVKKIVQDLKTFSHIDKAEMKEVNINEGLESTLNIAWNEIKYKAVVDRKYGDVPLVRCYPQQINQVFMNILVNASHAIEDHGKITVRTYHDEKNVYIAISDTGKGIVPEHKEKLFEPFFTTKDVGKGTGLGLSLAYNIIKKHNGIIDVESEVGKGSKFIITLPVNTGIKDE